MSKNLQRSFPCTLVTNSNFLVQPGYRYAGLQAAEWCTCGNSYGRHGHSLDSECNLACVAAPGMTCGGSWRNTIWEIIEKYVIWTGFSFTCIRNYDISHRTIIIFIWTIHYHTKWCVMWAVPRPQLHCVVIPEKDHVCDCLLWLVFHLCSISLVLTQIYSRLLTTQCEDTRYGQQ